MSYWQATAVTMNGIARHSSAPIAQVRDRSKSEVTKPIPQEFIDGLGRAQAEGVCFYNFPYLTNRH